eukprot:111793-Chlamydomonas_euryale.AAC.5
MRGLKQCNKAPKRIPELQGSGFKAPMTSIPRGGVSPRRLGGGGRGCARLCQGFATYATYAILKSRFKCHSRPPTCSTSRELSKEPSLSKYDEVQHLRKCPD